MNYKIIKPERRRVERRHDRLNALGAAVEESPWSDRRTQCWDLSPRCSEEQRKRCSAHFVRRNCWDLWGAEYFPPGRKPCCHNELDCAECPVAGTKFHGPVSIYVDVPKRSTEQRTASPDGNRAGRYCPHLFSVKETSGGRNDGDVKNCFKCHRRRGVILHSTYVSEVCGTADHRQCPFYATE